MRKNFLKSKMSLHEDNNKTLAHKLKITPSAFSRKINGIIILPISKKENRDEKESFKIKNEFTRRQQ